MLLDIDLLSRIDAYTEDACKEDRTLPVEKGETIAVVYVAV
ncbi:MAG: hypothetical protein ACYCSI_16730 [Solirubrobacteraceae bacterium]